MSLPICRMFTIVSAHAICKDIALRQEKNKDVGKAEV